MVRLPAQEPFDEVANKAAVETMPRTVNTGLGAMFILAALAVLGGDSLRDFAIALLLGLVIGTYSSVFTATPILTYLQQLSPLARSAGSSARGAPRRLRRRHLSGPRPGSRQPATEWKPRYLAARELGTGENPFTAARPRLRA